MQPRKNQSEQILNSRVQVVYIAFANFKPKSDRLAPQSAAAAVRQLNEQVLGPTTKEHARRLVRASLKFVQSSLH
jgi:hypothetical protein